MGLSRAPRLGFFAEPPFQAGVLISMTKNAMQFLSNGSVILPASEHPNGAGSVAIQPSSEGLPLGCPTIGEGEFCVKVVNSKQVNHVNKPAVPFFRRESNEIVRTLVDPGRRRCRHARSGRRSVKSAKFEDNLQVAGQNLVLNGAGVRVKIIVDVYAAGLYLPARRLPKARP